MARNPNSSLENISYTLNVGRTHFNNRFAIAISSLEELKEVLINIIEEKNHNLCFIGYDINEITDDNNNLLKIQKELQLELNKDKYVQQLLLLAKFYTKGHNLNFSLLHQGESQKKMALPTYPFNNKRYWLSDNNLPIKNGMLKKTIKENTHQAKILEKNWKLQSIKNDQSNLNSGNVIVLITSNLYEYINKIGDKVLNFQLTFLNIDEYESNIDIENVIGLIDITDFDKNINKKILWKKIALIQSLIKEKLNEKLFIFHFTHRLQGIKDSNITLNGAEMSALIPALNAEYSKLSSKTIDIDKLEQIKNILISELSYITEESEVSYRDNQRYVTE
jgi:acyl transferase domain-containing protein